MAFSLGSVNIFLGLKCYADKKKFRTSVLCYAFEEVKLFGNGNVHSLQLLKHCMSLTNMFT
jgi:hypothetical protein